MSRQDGSFEHPKHMFKQNTNFVYSWKSNKLTLAM